MATNKSAAKVDLKPFDEIFSPKKDDSKPSFFKTLEEEKHKDLTIEVPISQIDGFPNHPFKVVNDDSMQELVQSIKENGLIMPAIVRKKDDGRFELISGHRRKMACKLAGLEKMAVTVREFDRDSAIITMVDSNMQRDKILPSEKAFAYKMRLEAMKRQGERTDLTSRPMVEKLLSVEQLGKIINENGRQIQRYVRLTELQPEILKMVDENTLGFRPAVELSFLNTQEQQDLLETMASEERTPSLAQAQRMKRLSADGRLDMEAIFEIMTEEKPNEKEKFIIPRKNIEAYFPKNLTRDKEEEYVTKALEYYHRHLERQRGMER